MTTHEPRTSHSVAARDWSPALPEAPGFDHLVVETPGLHTHVAAIGEGEPVVLLHGFPQHWWQWRAIAPVIAARGYRSVERKSELEESVEGDSFQGSFEQSSVKRVESYSAFAEMMTHHRADSLD